MLEDEYTTLEKIARRLRLPRGFIRQLVQAGTIPHLIVGGRLRFQEKSVRAALDKVEHTSNRQKVFSKVYGQALQNFVDETEVADAG